MPGTRLLPGSPDGQTTPPLADHRGATARDLDRIIGSYLFDAALDLHNALPLTDRDDIAAHIHAALRRLDAAITELGALGHTSRTDQRSDREPDPNQA